MIIKNLKISNFKSFDELEIDLREFNVLIGSNASGKSNFLQLFKFLRDIIDSGFENAVSLQGGIGFLRNINLGASKNFSLRLAFEHDYLLPVLTKSNQQLIIQIHETIYEFDLKFVKKIPGYIIQNEKLLARGKSLISEQALPEVMNFRVADAEEIILNRINEVDAGEIILNRVNGEVTIDVHIPEAIKREDLFLPYFQHEKLDSNVSLIQTSFFSYMFPSLKEMLNNLAIYDFDPKLPKLATPITGKAELEEDGSNLTIVLKNIIERKNNNRKLLNLIKDVLPFIKNMNVEKFADKSLLFKLKETFFDKQYLPASLISDGTINILLLIIALYFEKKNLVIIEEPERNIHPFLISKVVNLLKDAAHHKQIIISTHNPEIVKYADLEHILLIARDANGISTISRPADKKEVKTFLQNEIGIEELFVQNLLGI